MARKKQYSSNVGKEPEEKEIAKSSPSSGIKRRKSTRKTPERINKDSSDAKLRLSKKNEANHSVDDSPAPKAIQATTSNPEGSGGKQGLLNINESSKNSVNSIPGQNSPSKRNTFAIGAISTAGLFLVLFVLLCIIPLVQVSYVVPVAYQDIENYTEQEPYTATISYTEREPYTITEAYTTTEPYITYEPRPIRMPRPLPPTPPTPPIPPGPIPPGPVPPVPTPPLPPPPQPVIYYADITKYRDVVQYRDVEKTRQETRYRPVQKQRTVTRIKQETRYKTIPVLNYLLQY
jgi:hypothetical protein